LVLYQVRASSLVLAALALVPVVAVHRMRLSVDASGVTVVNLLRRRRFPWAEISDFRMGRVALSTCLDVCKRDGTRVHAWVVTITGAVAYPGAKVESILTDLRQRLMLANAESQEDLDARAIKDALAAADRGEYLPASSLVAEKRVDAQAMAEKLIERSRRNRDDPDSEP